MKIVETGMKVLYSFGKTYMETRIKKKAEKDAKEEVDDKNIGKGINDMSNTIENADGVMTVSRLLEQNITMRVKYIIIFTLTIATISSYGGYNANQTVSNSPEENQHTTVIHDNSVVYNNTQYGIQVQGDVNSTEDHIETDVNDQGEEENQSQQEGIEDTKDIEGIAEEAMKQTVKEFNRLLTRVLDGKTVDMFLAK